MNEVLTVERIRTDAKKTRNDAHRRALTSAKSRACTIARIHARVVEKVNMNEVLTVERIRTDAKKTELGRRAHD
jgi:two-component sensor histidine kinase